jgi:hypothetical protein
MYCYIRGFSVFAYQLAVLTLWNGGLHARFAGVATKPVAFFLAVNIRSGHMLRLE